MLEATLKYPKYWNSTRTEGNDTFYRRVGIVNKADRLFLLHNARKQCVRSLQIAVAMLSRYVRRLAVFEKFLDEASEM